jgi:hypothetical protein
MKTTAVITQCELLWTVTELYFLMSKGAPLQHIQGVTGTNASVSSAHQNNEKMSYERGPTNVSFLSYNPLFLSKISNMTLYLPCVSFGLGAEISHQVLQIPIWKLLLWKTLLVEAPGLLTVATCKPIKEMHVAIS